MVDVATGATTNLTQTTGISEGSPDWSSGGRPPHESMSLVPAELGAVIPSGADDARVRVVLGAARRSAVVVYAIPRPGPVELRIFDVTGREVARPVDAWQAAGTHEAPFPDAVRSQIYLYRLDWVGGSVRGKFAVVR